jgi:hypothetical protein
VTRVERLRDGVRRRVSGKVAGATGMDELGPLEAHVDSLEVAVAENADLAVPLAGLVDALERDVASVIERRRGPDAGHGMGA